MREVTELAGSLTSALLPVGSGTALDLACGTGRHHEVMAARRYSVVGVDLSLDQLTRADARGEQCILADAAHLPFPSATFAAIVTVMTATDLDNLTVALTEARRVTRADGHLVLVMAHPCFAGVFQEPSTDGGIIVLPGYRQHEWFDDHALLGNGIRQRVGAMNVPLPALLNAISEGGWHLDHTEEDERSAEVPILLGVRAAHNCLIGTRSIRGLCNSVAAWVGQWTQSSRRCCSTTARTLASLASGLTPPAPIPMSSP